MQYAKEKFGYDRSCLFVNMNNFYFSQYSLVNFAGEFVKRGGKVLSSTKYSSSRTGATTLRTCYERYPNLKIVFTGSSVMRLERRESGTERHRALLQPPRIFLPEFLNLQTGNHFSPYTLEEILTNHEHIAKTILPHINPINYFQDYIHHGFYPFFLEKTELFGESAEDHEHDD